MKRLTTLFTAAILGITVIILMLRLTAFSNMAGKTPATVAETPKGGIVSTSEDGSFTYRVAEQIVFPTAEAAVKTLVIENPETNTSNMRLNIIRKDNAKSIYVSGHIAPGGTVNVIKLQGASLPDGKYECTAQITAFDPITNQKLGSHQEDITIYVGVKPEK